jgi:27-O-demethylrifamycin SV methyltransferase
VQALKEQYMSFLSNPDIHYDRVSAAWEYLVGEDLHFGYFAEPTYTLPQATRALTRILAKRAGAAPGMKVLDIGCGTGGPAICLAQEFGCRVVGISTSRVGVERARRRAMDAGLNGNASFHVADGTATGFADQAFDLVWIMETSHLIPDKQRLLRESVRLLPPGGKLALCDIVLGRETPLDEVLKLRADFATLQEVFGRVKTQPLEGYARILEEIGLHAEFQDVSAQVLPTFVHWKQNAERHAQEVSELLSGNELEKFLRSCDIMARFWKDRRLGYALLVATKPPASSRT